MLEKRRRSNRPSTSASSWKTPERTKHWRERARVYARPLARVRGLPSRADGSGARKGARPYTCASFPRAFAAVPRANARLCSRWYGLCVHRGRMFKPARSLRKPCQSVPLQPAQRRSRRRFALCWAYLVLAGCADAAGAPPQSDPTHVTPPAADGGGQSPDAAARGAEDATLRGAEDATLRGAKDATARGTEDATTELEGAKEPQFPCGSQLCAIESMYCFSIGGGVPDSGVSRMCRPRPAGCSDCACLGFAKAGCSCHGTGTGDAGVYAECRAP